MISNTFLKFNLVYLHFQMDAHSLVSFFHVSINYP